MGATWRGLIVAACVGALGSVGVVAVALPSGAGNTPGAEVETPIVDGTTITATYGYEHMPFFEGGFKMPKSLMENFVSIDCGDTGEVNRVGGPDGAPECGFHPAVTTATVVITGKQPWFDVTNRLLLTPYWSFDDKTYEIGEPIVIKADEEKKAVATPQEKARQAYLDVRTVVNLRLNDVTGKISTWDAKTTGKQAAADLKKLDQALDDAKDKLKGMQKDYKPAKKAIKAQIKAIDALKADITAAGGVNEGIDLQKWKTQFDKHVQDLADASTDVRAKLGVPATDAAGDQPPAQGE